MTTINSKSNSIKLTLPIDPAYVSAARLTASSISERMGFYSESEDVKAAVSEACIFIINHCTQRGADHFCIEFTTNDETSNESLPILVVNLTTKLNDTVLSSNKADSLGMQMMEALMSTVEIIFEEGCVGIKMTKKKSKIHLIEGD